ncbi:MAG: EamA family transporter [Candidatus Lokiarchaeota archaeon]|nr:EamA family transporter [Candidatus Lokiarchaeota archaeon]
MTHENLKHYILLVGAMFFWGGSWVSAKILVSIAPAMTIGFFRFLIGSAFFIGFLTATGSFKNVFKRSNLKWIFLAGLTGVFGYGVFFLIGMQFTTAAQGSIIAGTNPATVSIFAHIIHKERLDDRWRYVGFLLAYLGIVFVIGIQSLLDFHLEYLIGNLIIVCAMMVWGLYSSIGKKAMENMSSAEATGGGIMIGCAMFGIGAFFEGFWTLPAIVSIDFWWNILFLGGAVTFLGFFFYFDAIKSIGATRSAIFINLVPVFGTLLSVLILGEIIYWTFIVGLILVSIGIVTINFPSKKSDIRKPTTYDESMLVTEE